MTFSHHDMRQYHRLHSELEHWAGSPGFCFDTDILASRIRAAMQRGDMAAVLALAYDRAIPEPVRRAGFIMGRKYYLAWKRAFPNHEIGRLTCPMAPAGSANPPCEDRQAFPNLKGAA